MNPFKKKIGLAAAPTSAANYSAQIDQWLTGRTFAEKARLVAATKTGGDIEARVRFLQDGSQAFSLWLCVRDSDSALRLIPAPLEDGPNAGDMR